MAMQKEFDHPFKAGKLANAYVRMAVINFDLTTNAGAIDFAVYRSQADREAGKRPYPIDGQLSSEIFREEEAVTAITDAGLKELAVAEVLAHPDLADLTQTENGYLQSYDDEFGETHPEALYAPSTITINIIDKILTIGIRVWTSEADYLAGERPIAGGLEFKIQGEAFPEFLTRFDANGKGRNAIYAKAKTKKDSKYADAMDVL